MKIADGMRRTFGEDESHEPDESLLGLTHSFESGAMLSYELKDVMRYLSRRLAAREKKCRKMLEALQRQLSRELVH